jgi:class 3 adenylate cyclase
VFHKVVDRLAREHRGRVVKTVADEALLVFDDTTRAVRAAAELRGDFQEETKRLGLPTPDLRTGLHCGTVTLSHDGDVFGDAVNLASKIHTSAEPGQVVLSAAVRERLEDGAFELVSLGARELKNVAEPVEVFGMAVGRDM